jgi:hypothetical protein
LLERAEEYLEGTSVRIVSFWLGRCLSQNFQLQNYIMHSFLFQPFAFCTIGSVVQRNSNSSGAIVDGKSGDRGGLPSGGVMDRGLLPALINQVPNYFTLPLRSSAPLDPNVKSFPAGMQDAIWGSPTSLRGRVGLACLFQEALTPQQVKTLYDGGMFQSSTDLETGGGM